MTKRNSDDLPLDADDPERVMARHREQIIQLEAHGAPLEDSDQLWDLLADILAEVKRHRTPSDPQA